jgi:hypothetical protein
MIPAGYHGKKRKRNRLGILRSERPTEVVGSLFLPHLLHKKNVPSKHTRNFILGLYGKGKGDVGPSPWLG